MTSRLLNMGSSPAISQQQQSCTCADAVVPHPLFSRGSRREGSTLPVSRGDIMHTIDLLGKGNGLGGSLNLVWRNAWYGGDAFVECVQVERPREISITQKWAVVASRELHSWHSCSRYQSKHILVPTRGISRCLFRWGRSAAHGEMHWDR